MSLIHKLAKEAWQILNSTQYADYDIKILSDISHLQYNNYKKALVIYADVLYTVSNESTSRLVLEADTL